MPQGLDHYCDERRSIFYAKTDMPLPAEAFAAGDHEDSAEIRQMLAQVCAKLFRDRLRSIAPLSDQGTFHRLFRAQLHDGNSAVVRVNRLSAWRRGFAMHLDAWVTQFLQQAGLPAVMVHELDTSRQLYAYDYQIMEEASGTSLKAFDHDEPHMRGLLFELGQTAARLHGIEAQKFGLVDLRPVVLTRNGFSGVLGMFDAWRDYVCLNLEKHTKLCQEIGAISPHQAERTLAAFSALDTLLADVTPVLLHGDLGNHNVFTDGKTITALIDWEDCLAGDPVFDIAFWATFHPERRHDVFLEGYRGVRDLPDDFELRFWLYFLRTALSKTVLRHRFGLQDKPGRPPASLRIHRGLEKVESLLGLAQAA
jgi:Ser/Thr protein kinase RdoA (MazF antagonist)